MQTRPDIIRDGAEIFADRARVARFSDDVTQTFFAFASIRFAVLRIGVVARTEVRRAAAGSLQHLIPIERQKCLVPSRAPRERVNPIKTEGVIDSKHVKTVRHATNTLPPPIEIPMSHLFPVVERNSPVLSPLLSKLVVLEMCFRRRTAAPVERELIAFRKNV